MNFWQNATVRTYFGGSDGQAFGHLEFLRAGLRATPKCRRSGLRDSGRRSPIYQDFARQWRAIRLAALDSRTASQKKRALTAFFTRFAVRKEQLVGLKHFWLSAPFLRVVRN
jgi:hypothetical protein